MSAGVALRRTRPACTAIYQDVLGAPLHMVAEVAARARLQPLPAVRQAVANSTLGTELGNLFQQGRGRSGGRSIILSRNSRSAGIS